MSSVNDSSEGRIARLPILKEDRFIPLCERIHELVKATFHHFTCLLRISVYSYKKRLWMNK
jgi:hypothetical protein